jgi:hypothetical protein
MALVTRVENPVSKGVRVRALKRAGLSILMPGIGQWLQHRPIAAALHFSTVILAALEASSAATVLAIGLAIGSRLLSSYDAYQYERDNAPLHADDDS